MKGEFAGDSFTTRCSVPKIKIPDPKPVEGAKKRGADFSPQGYGGQKRLRGRGRGRGKGRGAEDYYRSPTRYSGRGGTPGRQTWRTRGGTGPNREMTERGSRLRTRYGAQSYDDSTFTPEGSSPSSINWANDSDVERHPAFQLNTTNMARNHPNIDGHKSKGRGKKVKANPALHIQSNEDLMFGDDEILYNEEGERYVKLSKVTEVVPEEPVAPRPQVSQLSEGPLYSAVSKGMSPHIPMASNLQNLGRKPRTPQQAKAKPTSTVSKNPNYEPMDVETTAAASTKPAAPIPSTSTRTSAQVPQGPCTGQHKCGCVKVPGKGTAETVAYWDRCWPGANHQFRNMERVWNKR